MIAEANILTFLYFLFSIFYLFVHFPSCSANFKKEKIFLGDILAVAGLLVSQNLVERLSYFSKLCSSLLFAHVSQHFIFWLVWKRSGDILICPKLVTPSFFYFYFFNHFYILRPFQVFFF